MTESKDETSTISGSQCSKNRINNICYVFEVAFEFVNCCENNSRNRRSCQKSTFSNDSIEEQTTNSFSEHEHSSRICFEDTPSKEEGIHTSINSLPSIEYNDSTFPLPLIKSSLVYGDNEVKYEDMFSSNVQSSSSLDFSNDSSYSYKRSFDDNEAMNTIESVISSEACHITDSNSLIMNDCNHSDETKSSIEEKISSENEAIQNSNISNIVENDTNQLLEKDLSINASTSDNNPNELSVTNENSKKVMKNSENISQVFDSIMSEISTHRTINNMVVKRNDKDIEEEVDFDSIISGISTDRTRNNIGEKRDDKDIEEVNVPKRDMDDNIISSVSPEFSFDFSLEKIINQNNNELISPVVSPKNSFGFSFERIMKKESQKETTTINTQNNNELTSQVFSPKNSFGFSFERIMKKESQKETTTINTQKSSTSIKEDQRIDSSSISLERVMNTEVDSISSKEINSTLQQEDQRIKAAFNPVETILTSEAINTWTMNTDDVSTLKGDDLQLDASASYHDFETLYLQASSLVSASDMGLESFDINNENFRTILNDIQQKLKTIKGSIEKIVSPESTRTYDHIDLTDLASEDWSTTKDNVDEATRNIAAKIDNVMNNLATIAEDSAFDPNPIDTMSRRFIS